MTLKGAWATALGLFLTLGILSPSAAPAQTTVKNGRVIAPSGPQILLLHAPNRIVPSEDLPVYISVKAGEADLKEIVWSFMNPPYAEVSFGSYRIRPGEEKEVAGHFTLSTASALDVATLSSTEDLLLYIKIWARDTEDRISEMNTFEVTLDSYSPKKFPPPQSNRSFAKNFGVIEGRIVPPISDSSEIGTD